MSHIFNDNPDKEKAIRDALSQQMGVEFYSPDDPEVNHQVDVQTVESDTRRRPHGHDTNLRPISIGDIIRMAQQLGAHASTGNETRRVLYLCCTGMQQLIDRLEQAETAVRKYQTAVIAAVDDDTSNTDVDDGQDDGDVDDGVDDDADDGSE